MEDTQIVMNREREKKGKSERGLNGRMEGAQIIISIEDWFCHCKFRRCNELHYYKLRQIRAVNMMAKVDYLVTRNPKLFCTFCNLFR